MEFDKAVFQTWKVIEFTKSFGIIPAFMIRCGLMIELLWLSKYVKFRLLNLTFKNFSLGPCPDHSRSLLMNLDLHSEESGGGKRLDTEISQNNHWKFVMEFWIKSLKSYGKPFVIMCGNPVLIFVRLLNHFALTVLHPAMLQLPFLFTTLCKCTL